MDPNLVFVRVEGDVLSLRPFRILAHYARNAQAFTERAFRLPAVDSHDSPAAGLIR